MKLTRAQINAAIRPGDVILVHYLKGGMVAAGIQFASGGTASHALCCLGGMHVVEADIGGVMHTFLDNYLTGKCRLTVKRIEPELLPHEAAKVCDYWRSCISNKYDLGMILHVALVFPVRRFLLPVLPRMAKIMLWLIGCLPLASTKISTCAELGARGLRKERPRFLRSHDDDEITPEVLLRDARGFRTVVVWDEPVLAGGH